MILSRNLHNNDATIRARGLFHWLCKWHKQLNQKLLLKAWCLEWTEGRKGSIFPLRDWVSCFVVIGSHTLKWIDASHTLRSAGVPSFGDWNNFMSRRGGGGEGKRGEDLDKLGDHRNLVGFDGTLFKQRTLINFEYFDRLGEFDNRLTCRPANEWPSSAWSRRFSHMCQFLSESSAVHC